MKSSYISMIEHLNLLEDIVEKHKDILTSQYQEAGHPGVDLSAKMTGEISLLRGGLDSENESMMTTLVPKLKTNINFVLDNVKNLEEKNRSTCQTVLKELEGLASEMKGLKKG